MSDIPPRIRAREEMATVVAGYRVAARLAGTQAFEVSFTRRAHFNPGEEIPPLRHGHPLLQQEYDRVYAEYTDQELAAEYRLRMAWEIGNGSRLQQRMRSLLDELYHGIPSPNVAALLQQWVRVRGLLDTSESEAMDQLRIAEAALEMTLQGLPRVNLERGMFQTEGQTECSICISAVAFGEEVIRLSCGHWFHPECIIEWLKVCQTCPFCRGAVELPPAAS